MKKILFFMVIFLHVDCHDFKSSISVITQDIFQRMNYSWASNNPTPLDDLRYITVSHYGFDGKVYQGELIIHKDLTKEVIEIFKEIFQAQYPIEKMRLVDCYDGIDELSAQDNNSYAFCSRPITGTIN